MKINTMKLKFAALLLLISVGVFSQNKIVLTAPRLDTSSLSNRINLKANTSLNNVNGVLSSTYGGAGSVSGILKANGSGLVEPAVNNSDYTLLNGTGFVRMSGTTPSYITGASTSFVKADGSLDGTSYAPAVAGGYLPLSGGTLTGALSGTSLSMSGGITGASLTISTSSNLLGVINTTNGTGGYLEWITNGTTIADIGTATQVFGSGGSEVFAINGRGARGIAFGTNNTERARIESDGTFLINTTTTEAPYKLIVNGGVKFGTGGTTTITDAGAITAISSVTASSFVKSGGTSTQFLKADGSVDGNTYLTSASITGKLNISDTATMLSNYARLSGANFTGSIGSTRGVFNNSTQSQLEIFGWNNIQGASTNAGEIRFGGTSSVQGRLIYSSAGNSTLYLDNTFDNANAEIKLRTRVAGTAVDALTLTSTAATFPSTMKSAGLIQPISLKTSNYTLTTNDHTVIFNTTSGNLTATLPAGTEGQIFMLRKSAYGFGTNNLIVTPNGSQTIEGSSGYTITACDGECITLQFLSGNWYIVSRTFVVANPC